MNWIVAVIVWVLAALVWAGFLARSILQADEAAKNAGRIEYLVRGVEGEPVDLPLQELTEDLFVSDSSTGNVSHPLSGIWRVECPLARKRPARSRFRVFFTNGDRLGVDSIAWSEEQLMLTIREGVTPLSVPLESLSGILPLDERGTWRSDDPLWLRISRLKEDGDVVLMKNGDRVMGEVTGTDSKAVTITSGGANLSLEWALLAGLRMNPQLTTIPPIPPMGWVVLLDEDSWLTVSSLVVLPLSGDDSTPRSCRMKWLEDTAFAWDWNTIRSLDRIDPSLIPLDSLTHRWQPLSGNGTPSRLPRRDLNIEGLSLRFAQDHDPLVPTAWPVRVAPRGWGLTSGVRAEWNVAPDWVSLHFGCGLDATACPRGDAILRVIVDGQTVRELELLAGEPVEWPASVSLAGAQQLVIEVEPGPEGEPCDLVNLISPRVKRH